MAVIFKVLTILVVGEETKLLLPGSKIITGRMQLRNIINSQFSPWLLPIDWKSVLYSLYKDSDLYFSPEREHMNCQLTIRLIKVFHVEAFSSASYTDPEW